VSFPQNLVLSPECCIVLLISLLDTSNEGQSAVQIPFFDGGGVSHLLNVVVMIVTVHVALHANLAVNFVQGFVHSTGESYLNPPTTC